MRKLVIEFNKIESDSATKYSTVYSNSKVVTIFNKNDIDDVFQSIGSTIISNIQKSHGKSFDWIFDSVVNHTIYISKYNPLVGRSYNQITKSIRSSKKRFE